MLGRVLLGLAEVLVVSERARALDRHVSRRVRPRRGRKSSGEAETTAQPSPTSGSGWSGRSGASRAARPAGSPRNGAERCWTTLTWYTSPRAIASLHGLDGGARSSCVDQVGSHVAERERPGWLRRGGPDPAGRVREAGRLGEREAGTGSGSGTPGGSRRSAAASSEKPVAELEVGANGCRRPRPRARRSNAATPVAGTVRRSARTAPLQTATSSDVIGRTIAGRPAVGCRS